MRQQRLAGRHKVLHRLALRQRLYVHNPLCENNLRPPRSLAGRRGISHHRRNATRPVPRPAGHNAAQVPARTLRRSTDASAALSRRAQSSTPALNGAVTKR